MKITDYLAIYAAFLSTVVFFWNVIQSRPKIKVDLMFGVGDEGAAGAYVIIRNLSSHSVPLSGICLMYQHDDATFWRRLAHIWRFKRVMRRVGWVHSSLSLYSVECGMPMSLAARSSHSVFLSPAVLELVLAKAKCRTLICKVQDALWKDVYSGQFHWPVALAE